MTRFSRLAFIPLLTAVAAVLTTTAVFAHASYDRSTPAKDEILADSPARVDIWFKQDLKKVAGANAIEVVNEAGERADSGDLVVDDDDRRHMSIGLKPDLPPGVYSVQWSNTSDEDGEEDSGEFAFTIAAVSPTASPSPSPSPSASPPPSPPASPPPATATAAPTGAPTAVPSEDDSGGVSGALIAVVAAVLAVVVVGGFVTLRRR